MITTVSKLTMIMGWTMSMVISGLLRGREPQSKPVKITTSRSFFVIDETRTKSSLMFTVQSMKSLKRQRER